MFAFEFEKSLFAFEHERPQIDPLFALPPTYSNLTKSTFLFAILFLNDFPFSDFPREASPYSDATSSEPATVAGSP
jgi:hypothetical protein